MSPTVRLADYLFTRLRQLGVQSVFGVPGDYNLILLDHVEPAGLSWIGTCNELNGGYAADGYARVNGSPGALITTFGVGELSAINAIAGSYAELVPVVHIVGTPKRPDQYARANVHHTLNDGEYGRFAKMYEQVTVAQVDLKDPRTCPEQIDWVLGQCLLHSRPVYLMVPDDMVTVLVDSSRLERNITIPAAVLPDAADSLCDTILDRIYTSNQPAILVDGESRACNIVDSIDQFVRRTGWPTFTAGFGKGLVNETYDNVYGVYAGKYHKHQKAYIDSADLILNFGPHYSRTNSYRGTSIPPASVTISFSPTVLKINGQTHLDLPAREVLDTLLSKIDFTKIQAQKQDRREDLVFRDDLNINPTEMVATDAPLDHSHMWPRFNPLLRSGDAVFGETGTPGYGIRAFKLPPRTHFVTMVTWLSIGYMLPAALGAAVAQRERFQSQTKTSQVSDLNTGDGTKNSTGEITHVERPSPPRTYLFIGDGSLQMTVQEISTILRLQLPITLVVINNDGYTVERCIHGKDQKYNDIAMWKYTLAPHFFSSSASSLANGSDAEETTGDQQDGSISGQTSKFSTAKVRDYAGLDRVLNQWQDERKRVDELIGAGAGTDNGKEIQGKFEMLEVVMDKEDAPRVLKDMILLQTDEKGRNT